MAEFVGVSVESWDEAGRAALADAASGVRGLRSAEIVKQDVVVEDGTVVAYRVRVAVEFDPAAARTAG